MCYNPFLKHEMVKIDFGDTVKMIFFSIFHEKLKVVGSEILRILVETFIKSDT